MQKNPQLVTIIPPDQTPGRPNRTQGTRVVLEDGSELTNVRRVVLTADVNDLWRAQIDLLPSMGVMAGMTAHINEANPSWWRKLLVRLAGVGLGMTVDGTSLESSNATWRKL